MAIVEADSPMAPILFRDHENAPTAQDTSPFIHLYQDPWMPSHRSRGPAMAPIPGPGHGDPVFCHGPSESAVRLTPSERCEDGGKRPDDKFGLA
jgi:hypothetical protein